MKDEDVSHCLSFMSSKTRSLIKNDRHSNTVKNLELPTNRLNDSGITLDYMASNELKTVDFSAAVHSDQMLIGKDNNFDIVDKIVNKRQGRPSSSKVQQPVSKRVLRHVSSMTKEDF